MTSLAPETIGRLAPRLASRELSPVELVRAILDRLADFEPLLGAYAFIDPEAALAAAGVAEQEIATQGHRGPLHGIPVAIKDNLAVAGWPTATARH